MSALAWLAIPVAAMLLAVLWVVWASRPKPPADVHDTVEDYQRFKAAFGQDDDRGDGEDRPGTRRDA
jgi:hypothetical protein